MFELQLERRRPSPFFHLSTAYGSRTVGVGRWPKIRAVYWNIEPPNNGSHIVSPDEAASVEYLAAALACLPNEKAVPWINPLSAPGMSLTRLPMAARAQEIGFHVPETLVAGDIAALSAFAKRRGTVVIKPILQRATALPRGKVKLTYATRLSAARFTAALKQGELPKPAHIMQYIEGWDCRVVVVGDRCFAALGSELNSERKNVDVHLTRRNRWRRHNIDGAVSNRLVALVKDLGLQVATVDCVIEKGTGHVYFLELHGAPLRFVYLGSVIAGPAGEAIARLLRKTIRR